MDGMNRLGIGRLHSADHCCFTPLPLVLQVAAAVAVEGHQTPAQASTHERAPHRVPAEAC
jgi:hypothetical protein